MRNLIRQAEIIIEVNPPFNFVGTVHKPSHFPAPSSAFGEDGFWAPIRLDNMIYGTNLRASPVGVVATIYAADPVDASILDALSAEISWRFGLGLDLSGFAEMADADPVLKTAAHRWSGMRPSCAYSLYELLCITTLLQNTVVSRTVKMMRSMLERYGAAVQLGGHHLYAIWRPEVLVGIEDAELRALKVGYRSKTFLRISDFFVNNPSFEQALRQLPKEAAAKRLREVYGVGPATVWYLLFESLKHLDALEHISPWEQKILSRLMFDSPLVPVDEIRGFATDAWGEYCMLAVHYLFEDAFWRRTHESIPWLDELIRL